MFADVDPNTPWWVAGAMSILTVALGGLRLYDYYKKKTIEWQSAQDTVSKKRNQDLTDEQRAAREDAAKEAVPVVERLMKEISDQSAEFKTQAALIEDIQRRERECSEERASDKVVLLILITWARKQKNPPPIPDELLKKLSGGSSTSHTPLGVP